MVPAEGMLVFQRLKELEGWADYIFEALIVDQPSEPVKKEMHLRVLDGQALRQLRELSWSLRDKLHVVAIEVEYRGAMKAAPVTAKRGP